MNALARLDETLARLASERLPGDDDAPVDLSLMLELWRSNSPSCRDVALEMADRDRMRSRRT